jgi:integrase
MDLNKKGTVSDVVVKYLNTQEYNKKITNKKTKRQYSYQLLRLVATVLDSGQVAGNIPIKKLNVAKCQQIYWALVEGVNASSDGVQFANYTMAIATRAWNVLIRYDKLEKNPWGFVERAKVAPRNMVWMPEHFKKFLTIAFSVSRWRNIGLLVRINVELGQRIEDIRLSEWSNYNFDEKLYMREVIQKTKERIPGIPLSDSLVQMLLDQKEDYGFQKYVVPNPYRCNPYSEQSISRAFRQIMEEAGLPKELQLRDIRRTVLTDLANHGATDTEIMAYSGHKSRESLMPYVCISTHQARNAAEKRNFSMDDDEWT